MQKNKNRTEFRGKPAGAFLSCKEQDRLVKVLARYELPSRDIAEIAGVSPRTVARTMRRLGIRPKGRSGRRRRIVLDSSHIPSILTRYFSLEAPTLDALDQLARENNLSMKALFDLIREEVSPSRWSLRPCPGCGETAPTPSPADLHCPACRKQGGKERGGNANRHS